VRRLWQRLTELELQSELQENHEIKRVLSLMDVDILDMTNLFTQIDLNQNGRLNINQFIQGVLQLRGPARARRLFELHCDFSVSVLQLRSSSVMYLLQSKGEQSLDEVKGAVAAISQQLCVSQVSCHVPNDLCTSTAPQKSSSTDGQMSCLQEVPCASLGVEKVHQNNELCSQQQHEVCRPLDKYKTVRELRHILPLFEEAKEHILLFLEEQAKQTEKPSRDDSLNTPGMVEPPREQKELCKLSEHPQAVKLRWQEEVHVEPLQPILPLPPAPPPLVPPPPLLPQQPQQNEQQLPEKQAEKNQLQKLMPPSPPPLQQQPQQKELQQKEKQLEKNQLQKPRNSRTDVPHRQHLLTTRVHTEEPELAGETGSWLVRHRNVVDSSSIPVPFTNGVSSVATLPGIPDSNRTLLPDGSGCQTGSTRSNVMDAGATSSKLARRKSRSRNASVRQSVTTGVSGLSTKELSRHLCDIWQTKGVSLDTCCKEEIDAKKARILEVVSAGQKPCLGSLFFFQSDKDKNEFLDRVELQEALLRIPSFSDTFVPLFEFKLSELFSEGDGFLDVDEWLDLCEELPQLMNAIEDNKDCKSWRSLIEPYNN